MSILSWFGKRETAPESTPSHASELAAADATLPLHPTHAADKSSRRSERVQRRELLYGVVRECMTAAGLLSSTYKFKVLSLDSTGREYLIMMDIPHEYMSDPARFAQMEGSIARSAKERFDMLVTGVYWRVHETVSARPAAAAPRPVKAPEPQPEVRAPSARPTLADEALAFKRAVAAAASNAQTTKASRTGRKPAAPQSDFSDTEPFDPNSPLGPSQFGGLN